MENFNNDFDKYFDTIDETPYDKYRKLILASFKTFDEDMENSGVLGREDESRIFMDKTEVENYDVELVNKLANKDNSNSVYSTRYDRKRISSVLDPQRETLAEDVWYIYSEPPVLKATYRNEIIERLGKFLQKTFNYKSFEYVYGIYIISSIATYHYNDYTDFDVKVIFDQDSFFEAFPRLKKFDPEDILDFLIKKSREDELMYSPIHGQKRFFDWYFYMEKEFRSMVLTSNYKFDSIYDVLNSRWLKEPIKRSKEDDALVLKYAIDIASKLLESFDKKFGRLRRNSLLYLELEDYLRRINPNSIDIRKSLVDVMYDIGKDLNLLYEDKEYLKMIRDKSVNENEMINIFSKKFKSSNYNDGNLIRKVLEKFGYWLVLVKLSSLSKRSPEISKETVEEIQEILSSSDHLDNKEL